jgi:signal transduction histidine kinase
LDGVYAATPENLQAVLEQTRLLKRLVDDLSTLALADAGRLHIERKPTDVGELVRQVAEGYRLQADQAGIRLGMSVSLEGVAEARLDAARVEQILGNLVSNAIRHTPSGGDILVRVEQRSGTDRLVLEVLDSGEGIPPDSLPYVFERFYRADRGRGRHQGGTGLGLAIARKLAEAHGGTLEAANRPEGGARFTLSLPLAVPGAST